MTGNQLPVWPTWDLIVRSMNARSNPLGRASDDPLWGVPITQGMIARARAVALPTPQQRIRRVR